MSEHAYVSQFSPANDHQEHTQSWAEFPTHGSRQEWTPQDASGQLRRGRDSCHGKWALGAWFQGGSREAGTHSVLSEEGQFRDSVLLNVIVRADDWGKSYSWWRSGSHRVTCLCHSVTSEWLHLIQIFCEVIPTEEHRLDHLRPDPEIQLWLSDQFWPSSGMALFLIYPCMIFRYIHNTFITFILKEMFIPCFGECVMCLGKSLKDSLTS